MSHQIIESELFVALSEEQVENISGGLDIGLSDFPTRIAGTNYMDRTSAVQGQNFSGPAGSGSTSAAVNNNTSTGSFDQLGQGGLGGGLGGGRGGRSTRGGFGF